MFSEEPHAAIRFVDVDQARQVDGVLAILTARDVPVNEYGLETPDQPVLCGPGSEKPFAERVRFIGDQVAVVIADCEETASRARALIHVNYEG